jgi:MerR family copper efflux transcriptional regulator
MLIGEFSNKTGLSQDTIRFYVRKGLLTPQTGAKGGRHPWQVFRQQDIATARLIRTAQAFGMSLKEIDKISQILHGDQALERESAVLDNQILRLEEKASEIARLLDFIRAKRDWVSNGRSGSMPILSAFITDTRQK